MKKFFLLIIFMFLVPYMTFALTLSSNYVKDDAKVLTEETANYMGYYSSFLSEKRNIDYYLVTITSLGSSSLEEYANKVRKSLPKEKNSILILFAKEDRKLHVSMGENLSKIMTDAEITEYINEYFAPYFQNNELDQGLYNGYIAFYKRVCNYYNIDTSSIKIDPIHFTTKYKYPLLMLLTFLGTMISSVFCNFFKRYYKHKKYHTWDYVKFSIALFLNVLLVMFANLLESWAIFLVLGVELVTILFMFGGLNAMTLEESYKKEKMKKRKRQKRK